MTDLSTTYLGLKLKSPLVLSASPLTRKDENFRRIEDAGASVVVMHSLFEEQIRHESLAFDQFLHTTSEHYSEAVSYLPELQEHTIGPEEYLNVIRKAKEAINIPVIGSLNGVTPGGWTDYAREIEQAGADALELNIYSIPTESSETSEQVEQRHLELVQEVKRNLTIPVSVKLSPFFTSLPNMAKRLDKTHVDGLVLFNRFYQPAIDLETLAVLHDLDLSSPAELRLRLRWIAILYGHIWCDMAVTGGVHSYGDVLKSIMVGAKVAMMTSAILLHGLAHFGRIKKDLADWLDEHEYESVEQMRGSMSHKSVPNPSVFERGNYMKILQDYQEQGS